MAACVLFLAWFTMKFHMDTANDSETQSYVGTLLWNLDHATLTADATGHYAGLAPYVMWPFTSTLRLVTGAYEIRGLVLVLLFLGTALYGLAFAWYRRLGATWLTSLLGLVLLSISVVFALLLRGWEIDKLIEPVLFLLAGLAAWNRRYAAFVVVAAVAAANRETGLFAPLVLVAALIEQRGGVRPALKHPAVWISAGVCLVEVGWLHALLPSRPARLWQDVNPERLAYVAGGMCLVPVFAVVWLSAASVGLRWLFYLLGPGWLIVILATDRLEQGAVLLAPLALACVPITLAGLERAIRPRRRVEMPTEAARPPARAGRESARLAPDT